MVQHRNPDSLELRRNFLQYVPPVRVILPRMTVENRPSTDEEAKQWLAEYRKGRTEALGRLVEHYRRPLYAFIYKMTENGTDADEIFQEVWFRAIKNVERYEDQSFLSWLFRIAHNLIIDRARRARPTVDLGAGGDDGLALEERLASPRMGPVDEAAGRDLGRRIAAAVHRLPEEQREVFLLRTEGDVPFKEIAKIQKTSINTALARMHYAVLKLRQELQGDYAALARG